MLESFTWDRNVGTVLARLQELAGVPWPAGIPVPTAGLASPAEPELAQVRGFWQAQACGEIYAQGDSLRSRLDAQARTRYSLEPYLAPFARFAEGPGRDVLEMGVGMGADHLEWARRSPRRLAGVDLTSRAIELTRAASHYTGCTPSWS